MSHLDSTSQHRLDRLRATDVTGVYAGDQPSDGADPAGAVTLTVDPTLRVTSVRVDTVEAVRTVEELNGAVSAAYAAALSSRLRPADGASPADQERPAPLRPRLEVRRPTPEMLARHRVRKQANARPRPRFPREVVGSSANACVTMTLPAVGPRGHLDADAGWLRQATRSQVGTAVTEAFRDAYSRRDS